jgi:hypothetical protein
VALTDLGLASRTQQGWIITDEGVRVLKAMDEAAPQGGAAGEGPP